MWLLAVLLVPLVFLGQNYVISEAQIAYVEVPKVALIRILAGLIFLLWSVEWAIKSEALQNSFTSISAQTVTDSLRPSKAVSAIRDWLKVHPIRWFLFAAALFFGSTFLSTALSGSFTTSIWGEIPGQDGYSAYTIASYGILFGVIATHLKSPVQLARLLCTVILMGVLVGLYGSLQHYGHDFLNVTESTGGGTARVTIFMGNTIFAGAVLAMTVPLTLVAAAASLREEKWRNWGPLTKIGQLGRNTVLVYLWAPILTVQILGLMFTFSRGPWGGAILAVVAFLVLVVISFGWQSLLRIGLVLGLGSVLSVAFLHLQGNVSVIDVGAWLGVVLALIGLAVTFGVLVVIERFGRTSVLIAAAGAIIVVVGVSVAGPSAFSGRGGTDSTDAAGETTGTAGQVGERLLSIKTDVLGGFVGGRGTHWKVSWELIKNRPWFEFDDLSLSWVRPLIGYGPDLFRYTYLLESTPDGPGLRPLEPDHAHNFFIHQTVEQGIFGGIASVMLFVSVFAIAAQQLIRGRNTGNPAYRLILFGLTAIILGRFLEMMVGVARISDLTVLWVIFGLFAALINFDVRNEAAADVPNSEPSAPTNRRDRRRAARASSTQSLNVGLLIRMAIVAWLVGVVGIVTWQKSINYVRASVAEGQALAHFRAGDLDSSIVNLDRAIKLAPGVPIYYNNRAQIFLNYQLRPDLFIEPGCSQQNETPYLACLGVQSLESNLESVNQQPFNYRARLASGNSAFNLFLNEMAIEAYRNGANMVPNSWSIRNDLAESQINARLFDEALVTLDASLEITGDSVESAGAFFLKGRALQQAQRVEDALEALNRGLSLSYDSESTQASINLLREINVDQGVDSAIEYFDRLITENPRDAAAYYFRGQAYLRLGDASAANLDIREAYDIGLKLNEILANKGYALFKSGDSSGVSRRELASAVTNVPQDALNNTYFGDFLLYRGSLDEALGYVENATVLDPELGLAYLVRSKILIALGLEDAAREAIETSIASSLPTARDYVARGQIHAFFGDYDLAFSDIAEGIRINPDQAELYFARALVYAEIGEYDSALAEFNVAIQMDDSNLAFFIGRGSLYHILGETELSSEDFLTAESEGNLKRPWHEIIVPKYFSTDETIIRKGYIWAP